ncbi:MAG: PAS domain S-box protein [Desulfobacterales bacterium]|nr:PAS domain S-box protein [Desulfobacterales bacterium]
MAEKPAFNELNRDEMLPEASLSQLQTAFDAINDAVCLLDMNGKILRCNKAMESLLKKSSGEIIGGFCWELIHGTDKPVKDCPIVRMKKTLCRETLVLEVDDKWLNVTVDPVIDETGNLTGAVHIISDITQRKQAEEALQESEEKYRSLINGISDTVWVIDFDGNFIDVNDAAVKVLGYSREELLSMGPQDIDISMDVEKIKGLIEQIPTDGTQVFETTHTTKDGKTIPVEIKSGLVAYQKKQAILSIARDITRRRKTEQALRESESRYRSIVEHTGAATVIIEEDTTISMSNTKFAELIGYSMEEIQGKLKWTNFVAEDDLERMKGYHVKRREREGFAPNSYEFRLIDKHRNIKNILLSIGVIPGTKKSVASLIDITHLKQIEASLKESERRLKKAVEGNPIPTFIIDNNHVITHWNKACEVLTGFPASEVVGTKKQWSAFYSEERPVMADFIVDGATEEEMAERYKHIVYNKSVLIEGAYEGENFYPDLGKKGKWLFFTAAPLIDQQGKIIGAIETFQDVTERRSMEKQLRQSQKLEAIGTLAGGIAHDFNNLLTVIIGHAQLALTNVIEDESLRKQMEEIKKAGNKAASLTRQLLAFSRRQIIKPQILDLNQEMMVS